MDTWPILDEASSKRSTATRKRRLLAIYLDYLIFGIPWTLCVWLVSHYITDWGDHPFLMRFLVFSLWEGLLVKIFNWTPGHSVLGIHGKLSPPPELVPAANRSEVYTVDPWLKTNERWWTILFGVLMVNSGVKTAVRWTMWGPPAPFLGLQLDESTAVLANVALGLIEVGTGITALQLRPLVLFLGVLSSLLNVVSTWMSWHLLPAWIEAQQTARRAHQGLPVREGEVEFLQTVVPAAAVALGFAILIWVLPVYLRVRKARASSPSSSLEYPKS